MLNFQEMIRVVDQLSPEELRELRNYIDQREAQSQPAHRLSPEERIRRLDEAARAIRAGFTEAEWAEVERAMKGTFGKGRATELAPE